MIPIELLIPQIMISLNEWNLSEKIIIVISIILLIEIVLINKLYEDIECLLF